jgi:hypothetical protein
MSTELCRAKIKKERMIFMEDLETKVLKRETRQLIEKIFEKPDNKKGKNAFFNFLDEALTKNCDLLDSYAICLMDIDDICREMYSALKKWDNGELSNEGFKLMMLFNFNIIHEMVMQTLKKDDQVEFETPR